MTIKQHRLNIRVDQATYNLLQTQAARRGESISQVARRILYRNLQFEAAADSQDALTSAVRKALRQELRLTEKLLLDMSSKAVVAAGSAESLMVYLLKDYVHEPYFIEAREQSRGKGVAFYEQPFEKILQKYGGMKDRE